MASGLLAPLLSAFLQGFSFARRSSLALELQLHSRVLEQEGGGWSEPDMEQPRIEFCGAW